MAIVFWVTVFLIAVVVCLFACTVWYVYRSRVPPVPVGPQYLGCFVDENSFGPNRSYFGGETPTSFALSLAQAKSSGAAYVAMARSGFTGGYGFTFNQSPGAPTSTLAQCVTPCVDDATKICGAADSLSPAGTPRLWSVYSVGA